MNVTAFSAHGSYIKRSERHFADSKKKIHSGVVKDEGTMQFDVHKNFASLLNLLK